MVLFSTTTTSTPSPGFSFNAANPATATGLSFGGSTAVTTTAAGFSFGKTQSSFQLPTTSTKATGFSLGTAIASTPVSISQQPSIGLGGLPQSAFTASSLASQSTSTAKLTGSNGDKTVSMKDAELPIEIKQLILGFRQYVTQQKKLSDEISLPSCPVSDLSNDIKSLQHCLSEVRSTMFTSAAEINRIKAASHNELRQCEMIQRLQTTPIGYQFEHTGPLFNYFFEKILEYESQVETINQQITDLEFQINNFDSINNIAPAEIITLLQRLFDNFVTLAANLQPIHENIQVLKARYLGLRKMLLGSDADIFEASKHLERLEKDQSLSLKQLGPHLAARVDVAPSLNIIQPPTTTTTQIQQSTTFGLPGQPTQQSAFGLTTSPFNFGNIGSSGSLFGSNVSTTQTPTAFSNTTSSVGGTSSLFGSPFGSSATKQPLSLIGSSNVLGQPSAKQPSIGGGIFGGSSNTGGLFGSTNTGSTFTSPFSNPLSVATTTTTTPSLFGGLGMKTQQSTGGIFGTGTSSSLFGNKPTGAASTFTFGK